MKLSKCFALLAVGASLALPSVARADFMLFFDSVVTGSTPGGTPPWASLSVMDTDTDEVTFTLTHSASSSAGQFLTKLLLNFTPAFPGNFAFTSGSGKVDSVSWSSNGFNDAGSQYDIEVLFKTSNAGGGVNRLKPGESVAWTFTGAGVDSSDFFAQSSGVGAYYGLIHIQGIGPNNEDSGKVAAVPEPASLGALLIGGLGLLVRRHRSRQ